MLQSETGPFAVFARLQAWLAKKPHKPGSLSDGFFCFYCLSVWVSSIIVYFGLSWESFTEFIMLVFAVSALAIFINEAKEQ